MNPPFRFDLDQFDAWFPSPIYQRYLQGVMGRVGVTRRRADCFVRLWVYLCLKQAHQQQRSLPIPLTDLTPISWIDCSCREAADVFYHNQDRGGDRAAGMMLDKLVALNLIRKQFDGNVTEIAIIPPPELLAETTTLTAGVEPDGFDPRCDAVPIANLLSSNYNWLNRNADAIPYRIANILRDWAAGYGSGMRVLRRQDNQNPVGFYALYPTLRESEIRFFAPPSQGLHLSQVSETDPFTMAQPGDADCRAVFVRSWMIESAYQTPAQGLFLRDAQHTLKQMQQDFPNLMDMYTLIIHPSYAALGTALGFQKMSTDPKLPLYWMYQAVDRFLALDISQTLIP
ncbi:MAG: hypothetical protein VKJ27_07660 [Synechocystis sp.]|nr:hypothetical protein [Synechocystis sp.]